LLKYSREGKEVFSLKSVYETFSLKHKEPNTILQ
jgi:hypothetical protein